MSLTDRSLQAFKPGLRPYKRADGHGLYLEVFPNGSKLWRLKYRYGGKEKRLALGSYPEVSLAEARKRRDINRSRLHDGADPAIDRRKAKAAAKISADNAFAKVAEEYLDKMRKEGRADSTVCKAEWFLELLRPSIGVIPVDQIEPQTLLAALKKLESRGILETARKVRSFASRVFRLAIFSGRAQFDPAQMLIGALKLFNVNRTKLERLIHRVFERAQLDLEIPDRFGTMIKPREWFLVPLSAIDEAVTRIRDGTITQYRYDPGEARLCPE